MRRKIYLGNGKWVTSDRLVNNELETQQSGKLGNRAKKIEPNSWDQREAQSLIALLNNSHVEEPLVQPEMFPVANADQVSHGDGGVTAWNETDADVRMTREQITEAQRLSREWLEAHPPSGN